MKRPNDIEFKKLMMKLEKEVAKSFKISVPYVSAYWNGKTIEITIAKDYELIVKK